MALDRSNEGWTALLGKDVVGPDGKIYPTRGKVQFKKSAAISEVQIADDEANGRTVVTFPTTAETAVFGELVAAARASVPDLDDDEIIFLSGYTTPGDGGEGYFRKSPDDAVDDGGTVLNEGGLGSNQPGLRRVYSGPLDARWFGAVGTKLLRVTSATTATPVVYTTEEPHGYQNGDIVRACEVFGNTGADGKGAVTVLSSTTFSIAGTVGAGAYTTGTGFVYKVVDSKAAIQRAIDTCPSGGRIYFPRGCYSVTSGALDPAPNITLVGDGQARISGAAPPATRIIDERTNPTSPLMYLGPDAGLPVQPTSRGMGFENLRISAPVTNRAGYLLKVVGSTGTSFTNVYLEGPHSLGKPIGTATGDAATEPGLVYLESFEGVLFDTCTFHYGTVQLAHLGNGAGGPLTVRQCWFYDCHGEHYKSYSNGDHDVTLDSCSFDPIYRTTVPAVGVDLRANGFVVRGCSFFGYDVAQPSGSYLAVQGTGLITNCNFVTDVVAITSTSGNVTIGGNVVHAYCGLNIKGGAITLLHNRWVPWGVPDNGASLFPFDHKRAIIVNEPYQGVTMIDAAPQSFESVTGAPNTIMTATNASPSVITTEDPHGLATDDWVIVVGATGNTAINGVRQVVVTGANTYTMKDAAGTVINGNGVYDAESGTAYPRWFFYESFHVGGSPWMPAGSATATQQYTSGIIRYTRNLDASSPDGGTTTSNIKTGAMVRLDITDPKILPTGTGVQLRDCDQAPNIITNEQFNGDVEWKLPPAHPGKRFLFMKRHNNADSDVTPKVTITADFATQRTVSNATGAGTSPIELTTTVNHGFVDGQRARVASVTTDANANGAGYVKVKDLNEIYLDGSIGLGAGGASGGTITVQDLIFIPGVRDGVGSIKNADELEFNALVEVAAEYFNNTATGEEFVRWVVRAPLGSWVPADDSGGFMPLSGKRVTNTDLGDGDPHVIGTLTVPTNQEIYVSVIFQFRKNDGTYWHVKRGWFFQRLAGTLTRISAAGGDVLGVDYPSTPPTGWAVTASVSGDDIQISAEAEDNVNVQATIQWDKHV